tara:strand:+ start:148 stop:588 length:441 start_codon:yes stop_codon:yes gene_type:complete
LSHPIKLIAKLEQILTYLKKSKIEYLKASDRFNLPEEKRFFNMQSTIRNRFFQDITSILRSFNVDLDNLVINRLNFEQIVASTNKKTNQNHLHKCVELDRKLNNLYDEALEIDSENEILKYQNERIAKVIEENIHLLESTGFILES